MTDGLSQSTNQLFYILSVQEDSTAVSYLRWKWEIPSRRGGWMGNRWKWWWCSWWPVSTKAGKKDNKKKKGITNFSKVCLLLLNLYSILLFKVLLPPEESVVVEQKHFHNVFKGYQKQAHLIPMCTGKDPGIAALHPYEILVMSQEEEGLILCPSCERSFPSHIRMKHHIVVHIMLTGFNVTYVARLWLIWLY